MGNTVLPFIIVVIIYADIICILKRNSDHLTTLSSPKPEKIAPTPNIMKLLKMNSYYVNRRRDSINHHSLDTETMNIAKNLYREKADHDDSYLSKVTAAILRVDSSNFNKKEEVNRHPAYLNERNSQGNSTDLLKSKAEKFHHLETPIGAESSTFNLRKKTSHHSNLKTLPGRTITDSNITDTMTTQYPMLMMEKIKFVSKKTSENVPDKYKNKPHNLPKPLSSSSSSSAAEMSTAELLNKKLTWLTVKVSLTYGITWLPSIIYYSIVTISPDTFTDEFYVSDTEALVTFFIKFITFFDAILAPVIYCRQSRDFRRAFRDLRRKLVNRKKYVVTKP